VGVQATKISVAKIHQQLVCALSIAGVLAVIGFPDRIGKRITRVHTRQHLLHLKLRSRTASDDWLGLVLDQFTLLAPMFRGIPKAPLLQSQRDQPQCPGIKPGRLDYAREIEFARIDPLFRGLYDRDLSGH